MRGNVKSVSAPRYAVRKLPQVLLLPAALALGFALAAALQRSPAPPSLYKLEQVVGEGRGPAAFLALSIGRELNLSQLPSCFLFEENETALVWLGPHRLAGVKAYGGGGYTVVVLELEQGPGEAYLLSGLKGPSEVYALVRTRSSIEVVPLLRVVESGKIIEFYGRAEGASRVEVYAFAAPEDYNQSLPPPPNLLVTSCEVIGGTYRLRLEKGGPPLTPRGKPLIEVNSTLVLYTGCSHHVMDVSKFFDVRDSVRVKVDLSCAGPSAEQSP